MAATEATSCSANTSFDLDLSKAQVLTADKAAEAGIELSEDALKAEQCPYCGKELHRLCIVGGFAGSIVTLAYEPCDCPQAQAAAAQQAEQRKLDEAAEARKREIERIRLRTEKAFKQSEMPERWKRYTFDRFDADSEETANAKSRASNFAQWFVHEAQSGDTGSRIPNGLMFTGNSGTGKTHLAAAILNAVIAQAPELPVIGATMGELLTKLKATYNDDGRGEDELMRTYAEVPLLLIDDLGSEQMTEWATDRIYQIVNRRYNANKPTLVTSNYADTDLAKRLTPNGQQAIAGAKVVDRLAEMCRKVVLSGKSHRSNNHASTDAAETNRSALNSRFQSSGDRLEG